MDSCDNENEDENDIVEESVIICTTFIFLIGKLQKCQATDIAKNNKKCYTGKNKLTIFICMAIHNFLHVVHCTLPRAYEKFHNDNDEGGKHCASNDGDEGQKEIRQRECI